MSHGLVDGECALVFMGLRVVFALSPSPTQHLSFFEMWGICAHNTTFEFLWNADADKDLFGKVYEGTDTIVDKTMQIISHETPMLYLLVHILKSLLG